MLPIGGRDGSGKGEVRMRELGFMKKICGVRKKEKTYMHRKTIPAKLHFWHDGLLALIALLSLVRGAPVAAQGTDQSVVINDPRPLAEAVLMLEAKSGQVITYEDPRYVYQDDVVDIAGVLIRS